MKLLGRRSLSSVLGAVVNFLFFGACALGVFLLGLFVVVLWKGTGRNITLTLPVSFSIERSAYQLSAPSDEKVKPEIASGSQGNVIVHGGGKTIGELTILLGLSMTAGAAIVLSRFRRIFRRLREGRPFLVENARDLRFIGGTIVIGELAVAVLQYASMRLVEAGLSSPQLTFQAPFSISLPVIFTGLMVLVIAEVFREGSQMRADLEAAREIQFSLVADKHYQHQGVSIESRMVPARDVGGDYYDVIDLGEGSIAVVVADVAGKGLPAALLMTLLRGSLRSMIAAGLRGSELFDALNRHLVANTPGNRMVTCFYAEIDPVAGRLRYVNAGHNPPYLFGHRAVTALGPTGIVLGMIEGPSFEAIDVDVKAGARLLVYTDGISEATNLAGDEFGTDRLEKLVTEAGDLAPDSAVDTVSDRVTTFVGRAPQHDDMTLMLVVIPGKTASGSRGSADSSA
jgi:hypothetical protein